MEPTFEVLAIHPAAWTALFQGLVEGIAYGLAAVVSALVAIVALLGRAGEHDHSDVAVARPAPRVSASALGGLMPLVLAQPRARVMRRQRQTCQRRIA